MKTIIAGSRSIKDYSLVKNVIKDAGIPITEIVSGAATGVDMLGLKYALYNGIPVKIFRVTKKDWELKGKAAGIFRNKAMGDYANALIAIWDGFSHGTKHMIEYSRKNNLQIFIRIVQGE